MRVLCDVLKGVGNEGSKQAQGSRYILTMARQRRQKEKSSDEIPLAHPDKSGPDPSRQTLLNLAAERGLLDPEIQKRKTAKLPDGAVRIKEEDEEDFSMGRFGESVLWSSSLAMLYFTFDVLTQNQYAEEISFPRVAAQSLQAFVGEFREAWS